MPPGSALFVLGSTYHHGGANHTPNVRHGITLAYNAGYLRTMENYMVSVSQEKAKGFKEEMWRLMGWSWGGMGGRLGMHFSRVDNGPLVGRLKL